MGTLLMDQIKKHASSFLQDKYKSARLAFTDVMEAQVLAEEATNGDPCSPDAKTMTRIAEASYGVDDYWRIVDVLHRRLYCVDWKQWRQSYKSLILLEFLLTHGPKDFAEEFVCDTDVIGELGTFQFRDDKGFNWGVNMQRKSEEILKLLGGGKEALKEARFRALRVSKEIQGFGSSLFVSPFSSSPSSSSVSESSRASSFSSFSTNDMSSETEKVTQLSLSKEVLMESNYSQGGIRDDDDEKDGVLLSRSAKFEGLHIGDCPSIQETGSFLEGEDDQEDDEDDDYERARDGFVGGIFSKLTSFTAPSRGNNNGFRSVSDVGGMVAKKKKFNRQFSLWY